MVRKAKLKPSEGGTLGGDNLTVTAQQSRFHTDAETSVAIKEARKLIVVKDLSIAVGNRELLCNAELHLQPGRHYVLVGRNGVGKTTLLTALASGKVPNIPQSTRILLLGQIQSGEEKGEDDESSASESVLEHVLRSDKQRETLLHEAKALTEAIENDDGTSAVLRVYRELTHDRLEREVAEAQRIATRRSGARGLKARSNLLQLEAQLAQSTDRLQKLDIDDGADGATSATKTTDELQNAYDMHGAIRSALASMDASSAEAKARSVLLGLGFLAGSLEQPVSQLSGGWRTRCSLACALCQSADLLLLDEPTNFLDLPSIIWFEKYIQQIDPTTTVIVVTHDRAFADAVGDELLVVRDQKLERFRGTVSGYEVNRLKTYKYLSRMKDAQEKQKKHIQATIDQNVKAAKRAGDDKKLKQAASRKKKLDERMGMEVSAKGTRFKLNRDLAGYHETNRDAIELPKFDPPATMAFPSSPSDLRFPGALVSFENVSFGYGRSGKDKPILRDINLTIHLGDRVGLVGLNGSGKSTLVSLAMASMRGEAGALSPSKGSVTRHTRARFGLYNQQTAEELNAIAAEDLTATALTHLMKFTGPDLPEKDARGLLSGLGLPGKAASNVPITLLSGGQKVRLALAKLLWNPPHLVILDEVTTHLDSDTIQALALALRMYEGAVLVVTHDRFFMRCVVEGESPRRITGKPEEEESSDDDEGEEVSDDDDGASRPGVVYRLANGKLIKMERGMQQYEERAEKASAKLGAS